MDAAIFEDCRYDAQAVAVRMCIIVAPQIAISGRRNATHQSPLRPRSALNKDGASRYRILVPDGMLVIIDHA